MVFSSIQTYFAKGNLSYARDIIAGLAFFRALDGAIAVNRWWTEGSYSNYVENLIYMVVGFVIFAILVARAKTEFLGLIMGAIAIYYIADYEIGGLSRDFLTPFDALLHLRATFVDGSRWLGLTSLDFRKASAILTGASAVILVALSRNRSPKGSG